MVDGGGRSRFLGGRTHYFNEVQSRHVMMVTRPRLACVFVVPLTRDVTNSTC